MLCIVCFEIYVVILSKNIGGMEDEGYIDIFWNYRGVW